MSDIVIEVEPAVLVAGQTTAVTLRLRNLGPTACHNLVLQVGVEGPGQIQGATRIQRSLLSPGQQHEHPLQISAGPGDELRLYSRNFSYANPRPQRIRGWQLSLPIQPAPVAAPIVPPQLQLICHQSGLHAGEWGRLGGCIVNQGETAVRLDSLTTQPREEAAERLVLDQTVAPQKAVTFELRLLCQRAGDVPMQAELRCHSQNQAFRLQFSGACRVSPSPTTQNITYHAQESVIIARSLPPITGLDSAATAVSYPCPHCQAPGQLGNRYCPGCGYSFVWASVSTFQEEKES